MEKRQKKENNRKGKGKQMDNQPYDGVPQSPQELRCKTRLLVSFGLPSHNTQMAPKDGWQQIPQQTEA